MELRASRKRDLFFLNSIETQVSGTAAKLGRPNAYHHCTLLVDVNKSALSLALERKEVKIFPQRLSYFSVQSPLDQLNDDTVMYIQCVEISVIRNYCQMVGDTRKYN